jgi:predicted Zn-dependent protease
LSEKVEKLKALYEQSNKALENREFSRSKRLVQTLLSSGVIDDPFLNLLSAKVHLELGEHREASEKAQKVINAFEKFDGLHESDLNLKGFEMHQKLITSYEKLQNAKKIWFEAK